jgi:hypothetical protein
MFKIDISYYLICFVAAFALYFKLHEKGNPPVRVVAHINPAWADSGWGRFFEAIIFALLGAILGTLITSPNTPAQAVSAGLGWTGLLSSASNAGEEASNG